MTATSVEAALTKFPFGLSDDDIAWVRKTRDALTTAQKIRQLFVHLVFPHERDSVIATQPAGFMPFEDPVLEDSLKANRRFLAESEIPPLLCQDLEGGGNRNSAMTAMPNQMALAATTDMEACEKALHAMASEAAAFGFNWSFTPCIDINAAFRSAIVGTRSYGTDLDLIGRHAKLHMNVLRQHGIATAAKHWPGEGYDERDQHLVTTINPLSVDDWMQSFGRLYGDLIQGGLLSVMSAHIAFPAYAEKHGVPESVARYAPATLSKLLNETLLRGDLGFNGVIVSDATPMAGLTSQRTRAEQVPAVIESGCDIFLFCTDVATDIRFMEDGLRSGLLSEQRLEDAVTRVLGLKAALGLHRKSISERVKSLEEVREILNNPEHDRAARTVAEKCVTLVKDVKNTLPLSPTKHRRVTWIGRPAPGMLAEMPSVAMQTLRNGLVANGFEVSDFNGEQPPTKETTDCILYVLPTEPSLGKSRIFIDWIAEQPGLMNMFERYWHDIPTVMISLGHPYHLYDAPRVPCYINAYANSPASQQAVVERLLGRAPFEGVSPIDPFAGLPDARY